MDRSMYQLVADSVLKSLRADLKSQWFNFSEDDKRILAYFIFRSKRGFYGPGYRVVHSKDDFKCQCNICLRSNLDKLNMCPKKIEVWNFMKAVDSAIIAEIRAVVNTMKIVLPAPTPYEQFMSQGAAGSVTQLLSRELRSQYLQFSDDAKVICAFFILRKNLVKSCLVPAVPAGHDDDAFPCLCSICFRSYIRNLNVCPEKLELWHFLRTTNTEIVSEISGAVEELVFTLPPTSVVDKCWDLLSSSVKGLLKGGRRSAESSYRRGKIMKSSYWFLYPAVVIEGVGGAMYGFGSAMLDFFVDVIGSFSKGFRRICLKICIFTIMFISFVFFFFCRRSGITGFIF